MQSSRIVSIFGLFVSFAAVTASADPVSKDIVVYGGTSGGVVAAVQAARSGKSVVLISPTTHLGGLTTSGLGWTDLGNAAILGGMNREFYQRVYQHYQNAAAWNWQSQGSFGNAGQGGPAFNATTGTASVFEPKVAEAIFNAMITEAGVTVVTGKLDLTATGVVRSGTNIQHIRLEDGIEYAGRVFIDASYEGDLMAGAGVSFTTGREANAAYNETFSGIQMARATGNQLPNSIDPYVTPGNAGSGLLPGVEADLAGPDGTGDARLQAYCFRMVLTDVAANRVMVAQPAGYNEADYELLFRAIEAGQTGGFFKLDLMPNRKTDSNNSGGISTDYIGRNYGAGWNWATLNHAQRAALAAEHEKWQRGLIWTLQNHPRVPAAIRTNYANWGLPADEFTDNNHWPWQIYVREARRMVSDYVMTQHHASGVEIAADSVGMAAYTMDSHNVQRVVRNGMVKNEGDVQMPVPAPYRISYRSITPKRAECTNLLVPWSLSATHMAFGSIRMEPVFMGLAQSAAIAAKLAIDGNLAVQDVGYSALRPALLAAGRSLGASAAGLPVTVIDNTHPSLVTLTGSWLSSAATPGHVGADYLHDNNELQGTKNVFYRFPVETSGQQRVFLRWTEHTNRASNARVEVTHRDGTAVHTLNMRTGGAQWNFLGIYHFTGAAAEGLRIANTATNGYVIADAAGLSAVTATDDSDDDGLTDLQEAALGLNPVVSDAAFIAAVKQHPDFFDLHSTAEIHDVRLTAPRFLSSPSPAFQLGFELKEGANIIEAFQVPQTATSPRRFFRMEIGAGAP